jgi:hypothetical protein
MSDYNKTTNFTAKDSLTTGDPEKVILGSDMDTELDNIETASGTKLDKTGGTLTGALTATAITTTGVISTSEAINESKGSDIASATTTDIGAATGNFVDITGTITIEGFGTVQAGTKRTLQFDDSLTLTYNATSMILPGDVDIITQAGDVAKMISLGSGNWLMTNYQRDTNAIVSDVSGYVKGTTEYIDDEAGAHATVFDVDAVIGAAWESIGPTDSGATNIWTALDDVTAGAKWVEIEILNFVQASAASTIYQFIYARKTGSSLGAISRTTVSRVYNIAAVLNGSTEETATKKIPVDTSIRFDLYMNSQGFSKVCEMLLNTWGM